MTTRTTSAFMEERRIAHYKKPIAKDLAVVVRNTESLVAKLQHLSGQFAAREEERLHQQLVRSLQDTQLKLTRFMREADE